MKTALLALALIAVLPFTLLADKEKDKDVKVRVPDKSGVSIEDITPGPGVFTFKIKNSNNYAVHVSGNSVIPYSFRNFEEDVKANDSTVVTGTLGEGKKLTEIKIEKVEKIEKKN